MPNPKLLLDYTQFPEPSTKVAFAGALSGRSSEKRHKKSIAEALQHPEAEIALFSAGHEILVCANVPLKPFMRYDQISDHWVDPAFTILLGHKTCGAPLLVTRMEIDEAHATQLGFDIHDLRALYMHESVGPDVLANLGYGHALLSWHKNSLFCGRCGEQTIATDGGTKRLCNACHTEHFPRTDPVAIMLITHEEKCLLGRTPNFIEGMYSCLAGFVEQGETLEEAVRRETFEEAGVLVGKVAYHASQPWPFPHSLMLGCMGEALDPTLQIDHEEMEDCAWFSREDVRLMFAKAHPSGKMIPPGGAIATHIIRAWLDAG